MRKLIRRVTRTEEEWLDDEGAATQLSPDDAVAETPHDAFLEDDEDDEDDV